METNTDDWRLVVAGCFALLAALHSGLGEVLLLRPLHRADAFSGHPLGRSFAERTHHFAWHLTSLSWLGIAALALLGGAPLTVAGVVALISGLVALLASRGQHLAWPVFLLGAFAAFVAQAPPGSSLRSAVAIALVLLLGPIGLLHVYWAVGGRFGWKAVLPEVEGRPRFQPGPGLTLLVAAGLFGFGALALTLSPLGAAWFGDLGRIPRAVAVGVAGIFLLRVVGDLGDAGVLKRRRGTAFARWDDRLFSPLSFLLGLGFLLLGAT